MHARPAVWPMSDDVPPHALGGAGGTTCAYVFAPMTCGVASAAQFPPVGKETLLPPHVTPPDLSVYAPAQLAVEGWHAHVQLFASGRITATSFAVPYADGHALRLRGSNAVADQPTGIGGTHAFVGLHAASAQSIAPLQSLSMPSLQISAPESTQRPPSPLDPLVPLDPLAPLVPLDPVPLDPVPLAPLVPLDPVPLDPVPLDPPAPLVPLAPLDPLPPLVPLLDPPSGESGSVVRSLNPDTSPQPPNRDATTANRTVDQRNAILTLSSAGPPFATKGPKSGGRYPT